MIRYKVMTYEIGRSRGPGGTDRRRDHDECKDLHFEGAKSLDKSPPALESRWKHLLQTVVSGKRLGRTVMV